MNNIGRYELKKEIGRGGMGRVYLAYDPYLKCDMAIKTIAPDLVGSGYRAAFERFLVEAQVLAKLNHPNIIRIFDISPNSSPPFITMEFVDGKSFVEIIKDYKKISLIKKIDYIIKITEGLKAVHIAGLIHRDLKPANIMLDSKDTVKIMDFGIIKDLTSDVSSTQSQEIIGTPCFMSPEQITCKKLAKTADLFSLGTIIYELITGENPYYGENLVETISNVMKFKITQDKNFKQFDRSLKKILSKLMVQDPKQRYQNCTKLMIDLKKYRNELKIRAKQSNAPPWKIFIFTILFCIGSLIFYLNTNEKKITTINKEKTTTLTQNTQMPKKQVTGNDCPREIFKICGPRSAPGFVPGCPMENLEKFSKECQIFLLDPMNEPPGHPRPNQRNTMLQDRKKSQSELNEKNCDNNGDGIVDDHESSRCHRSQKNQ